jgi:hypothetical protein
MAKNYIPRNFETLTVRQKQESSFGMVGDVYEIWHTVGTRLIAFNTRTRDAGYISASFLRDGDFWEVVDLKK